MSKKTIRFLCIMNICIGLYGCNNSGSSTNNPSMQNYVTWVNGLSNSGYSVAQGSVFLMQNSDCSTFVSIFNSCFGQNPAAPYIIPQPPVESSYVDPYYATQLLANGPDGESTTNMIYRLSDNDAMMTLVYYPPQAAYFGYQSYIFTRESSNYIGITPPRARTISPDPSRYELFASIGNDINNIIVQNQYISPWNGQVVLYITTSNQNLAQQLVANATASGINPKSIFVEPIGNNVITGNGIAADDLITLIRYAVINPIYSQQAASWQNDLNNNVLVYKVTNDNLAINNYPTNQYTARTINNNETSLDTSLTELSELLRVYLQTHQDGTFEAVSIKTKSTETNNSLGIPESGLVGITCTVYGVNCDGDNQDTSAYATLMESVLVLGPNQTAFIAGVNHSVTENNIYLSLGVYDALTSSGVASTSQTNLAATGFNSGFLNGSAKAVLDSLGIEIPLQYVALNQNISKLYVTFISRNCNNSTIVAAKNYCIDLMGTTLLPTYTTPITIFERSYILPGSTTGADVNYMVYPYIIAAKMDFISQ